MQYTKNHFAFRLEIIPEFECFLYGYHTLAKHLSYDVMFEPVPRDVLMNSLKITRGLVSTMSKIQGIAVRK